MPTQPEFWFAVVVAIVVVLVLAIWKHDRITFTLSKLGIKLDSSRNSDSQNKTKKQINVLNEATVKGLHAEAIIGRETRSGADAGVTEIKVAEKAKLEDIEVGRIVGESVDKAR